MTMSFMGHLLKRQKPLSPVVESTRKRGLLGLGVIDYGMKSSSFDGSQSVQGDISGSSFSNSSSSLRYTSYWFRVYQ